MARPRVVLMAVPLVALALLAGCATPDENREMDGVPEDEPGATPEYVMIDGRPYECHDTVNPDGVCDDYELDEGYTGADGAMAATSRDGVVEIGGHTYLCDDTMATDVDVTDTQSDVGRCETYRLSS